MDLLKECREGVQFRVRVQPRASGNELAGVMGEEIKVRLTAPPVEGEANAALCTFLAGLFKVPRSAVTVVSGQTSRSKIVRIAGVSLDRAAQILRLK